MIQRLPVVLNESALLDLQNIASYIFNQGGSERTALNFTDRIKARCHRIGDVPRGGRMRDDLIPGLRIVPFERSAVIAYVVEQDMIRIINVFYGGRDFETLLRGEESH